MDRRKRTARTVALMSLFSMTDIQENVPVASFVGDGSDLISLIVGIEPIQDLHGYDSPWPAGGGKNKFDISTISSGTTNGILYTVTNGTISYNGTASHGGYIVFGTFTLPQTGTYHFHMDTSGNGGRFLEGWTDIGADVTVVCEDTSTAYRIAAVSATGGTSYTGTLSNIQVETGSTYTGFAPYSNICPISGWTGANIHVSPTTDAADGTTYSITFPTSAGTVYGGTLDVTAGKLTVDRANIASYNGEPLPSTWISDRDVYAVGTTPTTGAQVVYELAAPIVYDLTPTEINTLLGTNNIWADTGEIKYIEYNV